MIDYEYEEVKQNKIKYLTKATAVQQNMLIQNELHQGGYVLQQVVLQGPGANGLGRFGPIISLGYSS